MSSIDLCLFVYRLTLLILAIITMSAREISVLLRALNPFLLVSVSEMHPSRHIKGHLDGVSFRGTLARGNLGLRRMTLSQKTVLKVF